MDRDRASEERTTATHYDVLGVSRRATPDQIRRAHRDLARRLHPDRHGPSGPATDAAAARMREVNAAWAVLRDPARRAAYDRELAGRDRPAAADRPAPSSPPEPADADAVAVAPAGPLGAVLGGLPWLVVLGLLVAIFVFTAYAAGGGDGTDEGGAPPATVEIADLRGQCIQRTNGLTLVVNCGVTPNEGRIVALAGGGAPCPEGTERWVVPQRDLAACTVAG